MPGPKSVTASAAKAAPKAEVAPARLQELQVNALALVSDLQLPFGPGFTVLTGETGAGKSLLIDALTLLKGGVYLPELLRTGEERSDVEGVFTDIPQSLRAQLEEHGIPVEEPLVLSRTFTAGRSQARINRRVVSLETFASYGASLIAIHGQGDQVRLLTSAVQLELLDRFGQLQELRAQAAAGYSNLTALESERKQLGGDPQARTRRTELLNYELSEIDAAEIQEGEDEQISLQLRQVMAGAQIKEVAGLAHQKLYEAQNSVHAQVSALVRSFIPVLEIDTLLGSSSTRLQAVAEEIMDIAMDISAHLDQLDVDEDALSRLEARQSLLAGLRRRYGQTLADVALYREKIAAELEALESSEARLALVEAELEVCRAQLQDIAKKLHTQRTLVSRKLAEQVEAELVSLGLAGARFSVAVESGPLTATGGDTVRFLIAPNQGESAADLGRTASGGELSRIMLALEVVLAGNDLTPVLVFDEVDTGVGGRLGEVLGRKLWQLGRNHQVICVSHLPQVAAYADTHFKVEKQVVAKRSEVQVRRLDAQAQETELASMLGATPEARSLNTGAKELYSSALRWKQTSSTTPAPSKKARR